MADRARRRAETYEVPVAAIRRGPSTAEYLGVVVALSQAAAGIVLAVLCVQGSTGITTDVAVSGTALLFTGAVFGVIAVLIGLCSWPILRGSATARIALVGLEAVLGIAGYLLIPTVGVLLTASAIVVIVLITVLRGVGRSRTA